MEDSGEPLEPTPDDADSSWVRLEAETDVELLMGVPAAEVVRADCVKSPPVEIVVELRESMDPGVDKEDTESVLDATTPCVSKELPEPMKLPTAGKLDDKEPGSKSDAELVFRLLFSVLAVVSLPSVPTVA